MKFTIFGTEFSQPGSITMLLVSCFIFFGVGVKTGWEMDDFKENLNYNVPFSVAVTIRYYWRVCPNLYKNIGSKEDRASCGRATTTHLRV